MSIGSQVASHMAMLIEGYLESGQELQDYCDAYGKHAKVFMEKSAKKKAATPKKGAASKGKGKGKAPTKKADADEEAEELKKVFILHDTTAKAHGVFCEEIDEEEVAEALKNGGKESIPATLTRMKYKYTGYPFDKSLLSQVKKALATLDGFEVIEVKDLSTFEIPEGTSWTRTKPKAAPKKAGSKAGAKKGAVSKGKGKGKAKAEPEDEEEEAEEEEEEAPPKKAPAKKPSAGKKAGPSPGMAKAIAAFGLKKNEEGNMVNAKTGLVFLELKLKGKPMMVCIGTQGESSEDSEDPLESVLSLTGEEDENIKALSKTAKMKVLVLRDVVDQLSEEDTTKLVDNGILVVDDEEAEEEDGEAEEEEVEEDEE